MYVAKKIFLTKGVGRHREKLVSFELALRAAGLAPYNLVGISSIFPPHCELVSAAAGIEELEPGQIVHSVLAKEASNEHHRLIAASIGVAIPKDPGNFGYLSEHHGFGEDEDTAGDYAEDLAAEMLATIRGVDFDAEEAWDVRREIWKLKGEIVETQNVTQTAAGERGSWTSVLAAAVLLP